ncbi:hypothetical protein QL285_040121 [Trifolium repens]|nr:hypothetical protein QL285_040121 [Trifolium repens]
MLQSSSSTFTPLHFNTYCLESGGGVFGAAGGVLVVFGSRVFFFLGFGGGSVFCLLFCIQFPSIESFQFLQSKRKNKFRNSFKTSKINDYFLL